MGTENMIRIIKEVHPERIVFTKIGTFYHCYGRDAYIISYLFDYQLKNKEKLVSCGFPKGALNKVEKLLENKSISYMLVSKSDNYDVEEENDFKNKNTYLEYYNKANKYISRKNKIDVIYNYLLENINDVNIKDKIDKVEKLLYEI